MLVVYNGTHSQLHVAVSSAQWSTVVDPMDYCKPDLNGAAPESLSPLSMRSKRQGRRRRTQLALGERSQYVVDLPRKLRGGYRELSTGRGESEWPWRVYVVHADNENRVLVIPKRDLSCFLRELDDDLPLSSLMLPGTHQTMALYGWPHSKCQWTGLAKQLAQGIRVLDIRLKLVDGELLAYHGIWPEQANFVDIINTILAFLDSPAGKSETVVMSVKPEDDSQWFNQQVWLHVESTQRRWFLENRIPRLGEVRGKIVLFSRFGGFGWPTGIGVGIHPPIWPNNEQAGFEFWCGDTLMRVQDWYGMPSFLSIPEKVGAATELLLVPRTIDAPPTLNMSFFSASSLFALPPTVALGVGFPEYGLGFHGVNARATMWFLGRLSEKGGEDVRLRGWAMLDYFDSPTKKEQGGVLCPLLVECNWRGRVPGEEGWPKAM